MLTNRILLKKLSQVLLHLLFWIGVLFFFTYFFKASDTAFYDSFKFALFLMPTTIATTYVATYKLIPYYLVTKRYWRFLLYALYTFVISLYLLFVSIFFSLIYISKFEYTEMNPSTKNILFIMTAVYLVVTIVSAFKLSKLNLRQVEKTKQLATKILDTQLKLKEQELNYLKMQIHPHFLFNTLNTMYGFALKKADETPEMILKLSNLLDYLLYQTDKPFVLLSEEIEHIRDYVALEKMRFNESLQIEIHVENVIPSLKIAPMLLLPFIENSFKHGAMNKGILTISIRITCTPKTIDFFISNTTLGNPERDNGIGLKNIQKRLDLLYKNNHSLSIEEKNGLYAIHLSLNVN